MSACFFSRSAFSCAVGWGVTRDLLLETAKAAIPATATMTMMATMGRSQLFFCSVVGVGLTIGGT
jgi:hypothetical protein